MNLIIASNNSGKIDEIKSILGAKFDTTLSQSQAGINVNVDECGKTFYQNALLKAKAIHQQRPECAILADDSGLVVYALNGEPGILSARYAGENATARQNNLKLISEMSGKKDRSAYFICCMVLIMPSGRVYKSYGRVYGHILSQQLGGEGFGYDPLFYYKKLKKTFAQLTFSEKNQISHRRVALEKLTKKL